MVSPRVMSSAMPLECEAARWRAQQRVLEQTNPLHHLWAGSIYRVGVWACYNRILRAGSMASCSRRKITRLQWACERADTFRNYIGNNDFGPLSSTARKLSKGRTRLADEAMRSQKAKQSARHANDIRFRLKLKSKSLT